ncbi:hypothetical protein [Desulfurispora thermophila]|uniref:hypothetical protein n=1 Tax=Desulfurispora thermophila TaxID=265470 RepID=UPI000368B8A7|nr:hypothetical protein [Desulfurispora thermophila]
MLRKKRMWQTAGILLLLVALLSGCGKYNPFQQLGVSNKEVPDYQVSGEVFHEQKVGDQEVKAVWATVNVKGFSEEQAKKVIADYISKQMEKRNFISVIVKETKTEKKKLMYEGMYFGNKEAASMAGKDVRKIEKFPVIFYNKIEK